MSVYVDILPDGCDSCVCNDDYWRCGINDKPISHNGRREDCPLKEIVRYKDCINNDANCSGEENWCYKFGYAVDDDGYCNYGEKQVTSKSNNPDDSLVREDSEACKEQKSKLESDLISRQAAIKALGEEPGIAHDTDEEWAEHDSWVIHRNAIASLPPVEPKPVCEDAISRRAAIEAVEKAVFKDVAKSAIELLPPIEPPKKVVAQFKVDIDELMDRIKEEYEIKDRPVCEDAISKHDLWRIIEDNAYWVTYNETSKEKGMTLTGINQALNECPPAEPERPKGEWIIHGEPPIYVRECPKCGAKYHYAKEWGEVNYCSNCGCDCRGDK